jgi:plastocyanin
MIRSFFLALALIGTVAAPLTAAQAADSPYRLTIRNHRFEPMRLEIPAGKKIRLHVHNADASAEEFESYSLNREKLVPAGMEVVVYVGPLDPGEYKFFGDFHQATAQGVIVAR